MKIKQIRNATLRIGYAGKTFLVDPWLATGQSMGRFVDIPGQPFHVSDPVKERIPMPIFDLPEPAKSVLAGVDAYIVTHIHPDHIDMGMDGTVGSPLDKNVPVFVQNEADAVTFQKSGFQKVEVLDEKQMSFGAVRLAKAPARHGTIVPCGEACGVLFAADGEKTLYLAGDTIWYDGVENTLKRQKPDVVVLNACAAELVGHGRLIMNDEDVECVARTAPGAKIIVSHMDNVAHASITRHVMRGLLARRGVKGYEMPEDGETLEF